MQAPQRRTKLRLTRRGRLLLVLTVLLLLIVGFSAGRVSSQAASHLSHQRPPTVTVQQGETLWQLAMRIAPHTDPRLVVAQIEQINHLPGAQVFAGQQLIVPS